MKYLGAYLLTAIAGEEPSAAKITEILESAAMVKLVLSKMEGKTVAEVLASGMANLEQVGGGGGGGAAAGGAAAGGAAAAGGDAGAAKKEEAAEEEEEAMDFDLFD